MHLSAKVVGSAMRAPALARQMSSTGAHVWINKDTKVICQGFTGKTVLRLISSMDGGDIARLLASWRRGFFGPQRLIGPCSDLPLNGGGCRALSTARRPSSTAQRWWAVPTRRRRVRCTWVCPFSQTYARYCCSPCLQRPDAIRPSLVSSISFRRSRFQRVRALRSGQEADWVPR